ncbi:MAG: hypothetical protein OJI67_16545 [Prosthecobacter sp.]|nr:hypothetical protein [Prosthecobacter sp.]
MTKTLRLSFLTVLIGSSASLAETMPPTIAGSYQALLFTEAADAGDPAGLITLTVSAKGAVSGKLITDQNKTYSFKTTLDYTAVESPGDGQPLGSAAPTTISIKRGKLSLLNLDLTFKNFSVDVKTLEAALAGEIAGQTIEGFKVKTYGKNESAPALGAYTSAFKLLHEAEEEEPAGPGYAIGKIDAKGTLKLIGKTGDGKAFTASMPGGSKNQFALFVNPYKRVGSYLAGKIVLSQRGDDKFHMATTGGVDGQWKKAGSEKDKSYRAGFGPLGLQIMMEPWTVPTKGQSVASLFGIDPATVVFKINFRKPIYNGELPSLLTINAKNALVVRASDSGLNPNFDGYSYTGIFTGKVDPKTGKLTASLNFWEVQDNNFTTKKRKLLTEGVLLNFEGGAAQFGSAFSELPPVNPKTETTIFDMVTLTNIQTDPLRVLATEKGLAGLYEGIFDQEDLTDPAPQDMPPSGAVVNFALSDDMQTFTFYGRTTTLWYSDLVGGYLIYSSINVSEKDYISGTLHYNPTTGKIFRCEVLYEKTGKDYRFGYSNGRQVPQNTIIKLP